MPGADPDDAPLHFPMRESGMNLQLHRVTPNFQFRRLLLSCCRADTGIAVFNRPR